MADRPPLPVSIARALLVLVFEAALLAWGFGGVETLFASPRALALLLAWGVTGVALAVWRPVRGQDVSRSEKDPLALLALALLPLAIPGVAAWGARAAFWLLPQGEVIGWLGVGLSSFGLYIRVSAMRQLGARFSPVVALQRSHALETHGWYALVRHPGYLGAQLASYGAAIAFGSAVALPLVVAMTLFQVARMRREETMLAAHFGDAWLAYARRTPAIVPWYRRDSIGAPPGAA